MKVLQQGSGKVIIKRKITALSFSILLYLVNNMTPPFKPFRRERPTKIVATLGPASSDKKTIRALFEAGADVFRLNFSHGTHDDHLARLASIREIERETGRPIPVLADLQGPKLRVGVFAQKSIDLTAGQTFRFDLDPTPGDKTRVQLPHLEIFAALKEGSELLCDDGKVRMRVIRRGSDFAEATVLAGQKLSDRKGVNVPDVVLPLSVLTDKDRADLAVALDAGVDWIALSFVQRPEDIAEARALIGARASILAKLEKPSAVKNLLAILDLADGVMVARGDLGVEMPPEDVPHIQREIVRQARRAGKPVIVAPGLTPKSPESAVGPALVTVEPPSTEKVLAVPRIGAARRLSTDNEYKSKP